MKINNKNQITIRLYGLVLIIITDIILLFTAKYIFNIGKPVLFLIFSIIFIFTLWQIIKLRTISLEITEHIFSVKYNHPLRTNKRPVLEVPTRKIISLSTNESFLNNILIISITTKRGIRSFYYKAGKIANKETDNYKILIEMVKNAQENNHKEKHDFI